MAMHRSQGFVELYSLNAGAREVHELSGRSSNRKQSQCIVGHTVSMPPASELRRLPARYKPNIAGAVLEQKAKARREEAQSDGGGMRFMSVYNEPRAVGRLYDLLSEREPHVNISHKALPTWAEHAAFVNSHPYEHWYLIELLSLYIGTIYLTRQREVGLFLFKPHQGKGYGKEALSMLLAKHPGRLLANVSVRNAQSLAFFTRQGFKLVSVTMEYPEEQPCSTSLPAIAVS
jgi:RimJ/RimL family protein N-acetyltransferase